jgi:WD40 repeat protein
MLGWLPTASIGWIIALVFILPLQAQPSSNIEIVPALTHSSGVNWSSVSRDGTLVVTASSDSTVKLWDVGTGRLIRTFRGAGGLVMYAAFMPDGKHIVSAGANGTTIDIWDIATGKLLHSLNDGSGAVSLAVPSPDGGLVLGASGDNTARLWDWAAEKPVRKFTGHRDMIFAAAFSPDGKRLVTGSKDGTVKIWDVVTAALVRNLKAAGWVYAVAFSPDGRYLLSGSERGAQLWSAQTGALLHTMSGHSRFVRSVAFSDDGTRIFTADPDNTVRIWNVATGRLFSTRRGDAPTVDSIIFAKGGELALSASMEPIVKLRLWKTQSGEVVQSFLAHTDWIDSVTFTPDALHVLSTSRHNHLIYQWEANSGRLFRVLSGHTDDVAWVSVSPDGKRAASGSSDRTLRIWDLDTGQNLRTLTGHEDDVVGLGFSADGRRIVSESPDNTARIWDVESGLELQKINHPGRRTKINAVAFAPDGTRVIVAAGASIVAYDVTSGQPALDWRGHTGVVTSIFFSEDGKYLVSGSADATVRLWDAATGAQLRDFSVEGGIVGVAFSRKGRIAAGGHDRTLYVWSAATGELVQKMRGHLDDINSVAFSPDGDRLVSASADGTIKIWSTETGDLRSTFAARANRDWLSITPEGFFGASSPGAADLLTVVRRTEVYGVDQMWQSLYSPDLVREKLLGDPDREEASAARVLNLSGVLASGSAPIVTLLLSQSGSSAEEVITAQARVDDQGGGIGRVEWRVNGVTVAVDSIANAGRERTVSQRLVLDPGENVIEVIAYNARELLASLPSKVTVSWNAPANPPKPKLHIIAIGINAYEDNAFHPLRHAVADAKAFGAAFKLAAEGLYADAEVTYVLDSDATAARLDAYMTEIGGKMHPRDVFVFLAAAHGLSENGRFYLIPADYRYAPGTLTEKAIGQEKLQDWFANKIKARRGLVLVDTCESGALVGGRASGTDLATSDAAVGRLNEAIGRPVVTAAAADQAALEGYQGHGVFTYALLHALVHGDSNRNGMIELSEFVAHIQGLVPQLSRELHGGDVAQKPRGFTEGTIATRLADFRQKPKTGARGEDFPLVSRLSSLPSTSSDP